ncbi:MAG TPA: CDP-alcohol phosphatidyltransferase family protein, partial [Candidatus Saccharimonadales bacterium]|nr:CDP-alcohol phosphatidyltransferase family protein [Candidatus Saccharimonadales bacterium]
MRAVAGILNTAAGGRVSPNMVTVTGFLAHIPIAWLIATRHNIWAAGLLLIFGLFDTLDGELARLQKRATSAGMLLDASTDKMKETLLYIGAAYGIIASTGRPYLAVWAVAACGASLCVSYVKAKGETAVKDANLTPNEINRLFGDGLMRFEVRMSVLFVGLLSNRLALAVIVIAVLSALTALGRLIRIIAKLNDGPRI